MTETLKCISQKDFNSQPHKEADTDEPLVSVQELKFQLTASQGG